MRVTDQMMFQNMAQSLDQAQAAMVKTQEQVASGLSIQAPSDNPAGTAQVLQLDGARKTVQGWTDNANTALSQMQTTDQAMTQIQNLVDSAVSIATKASSGSQNQTEFHAEASQVTSLASQLQALANTTYDGRYVFSGVSQQPPVVSGAYNPQATSVPQTYEVGPGVKVPVTVDGNQAFNAAPAGQPNLPNGKAATLLNVVASLETDLQTGNEAGIDADLGALQAQVGNLANLQAVLGTSMDRIQAALSQLQVTSQSLQTQQGKIQNVDLAKVATQLAAQQTTYQAAISAGANLAKLPTLANYLS